MTALFCGRCGYGDHATFSDDCPHATCSQCGCLDGHHGERCPTLACAIAFDAGRRIAQLEAFCVVSDAIKEGAPRDLCERLMEAAGIRSPMLVAEEYVRAEATRRSGGLVVDEGSARAALHRSIGEAIRFEQRRQMLGEFGYRFQTPIAAMLAEQDIADAQAPQGEILLLGTPREPRDPRTPAGRLQLADDLVRFHAGEPEPNSED